MLEKTKSIINFKHSFSALIGISVATILNLFCEFSQAIISFEILLSLLFIITLIYLSKYKALISFFALFIVGLISSEYYNSYNRVYSMPDNFHEHKAWIKGEITKIKHKNKYSKIYLNNTDIYSEYFNIYEHNTPKRIIISTFKSRINDAKIGDTFVAKVLLQQPSGKLFKDDFDYSKYLLQNKINLTAQVRGELYFTPPEKGYSLLEKIMNYRLEIISKNNDDNPDTSGVTTALITGTKGLIPYNIQKNFKNSGLAHLMTISGMHMTFLFGLIFLTSRYLICLLLPKIALNYSSKKISCFIALIFAAFYMVLAGMSLPTIRAFSMVLVFSITIMLNRTKIALHSLCLIAIGILICNPIAIFSASFQLSFAAVFAILIYHQAQTDELIIDFSKKGKFLRATKATINISIIAFCATMFFVASHFGYISIYAIFANIIASILMTFLVMPSLILYYFGFVVLNISIFNKLNSFSIDLLNSTAEYFANFANSSIYISPEYSFALLIVSLSVITIITFDISRKYLISLGLLTVAFLTPIKLDLRPKIISINNSQAIAVRENNNLTIFGTISKRNKNKILNFYRLNEINNNLPKNCDISGCVYKAYNKKILQLNEGFSQSPEDINLADYIIN